VRCVKRYPRLIAVALALCLALAPTARAAEAATGIRLKPQQLYPGIRAAIPESFAPMTAEMFVLKYGSASRKTTRAFSDAQSAASIVFDLSPEAEEPALLRERTLRRLQSDPAIRGATASQSTVSGRPAVVFEFESMALDTSVFNILFFIRVAPQTTLVGNFNCPLGMAAAWRPTAREVLASIAIDR
jgi:hypothetical protein